MAELDGKRALVVVTDIEETACEQVASGLRSDGLEDDCRQLDDTSPHDVETVFQELKAISGFDILAASAAIAKASPVLDVSLDDWNRILPGTLTGAFHRP